MISQVYDIYKKQFEVPFPRDPAACACFTRIDDWFQLPEQQRHIKPNFDKDKLGQNSWTEVLATLKDAACQQ